MKRILFIMLAMVLVIGLTVPTLLVAANGTTTIYVRNIPPGGVTGGTNHTFCSPDPEKQDEWHFILNQVKPPSAIPAEMTAVFQGAGTVIIPLEKITGTAAHYTLEGVYLDDTLLSGYAELDSGATYKNFVLSHAPCGGGPTPEEIVEVHKTVVTSYTRTHNWSIDKAVDTESGYEHEGYPKIWLFVDGSGDETATWTVDVTYEGYEDSDFNVSGTITIENTGNVAANITSVHDLLAGTPIDVDWGSIEFPYVLDVGEILVGTYSVDVESKITGYNTVTVTTETRVYPADPVEIVWGDPTTEVNETVTVVDTSDLFGEVTLGTVTAPNNGQFTYTKNFAWEDYGTEGCGEYTYDNTAEVIGDDEVVLDSDDATLKVNVQCYIYETAYARGDHAICFIPTFANWGWTNPITPGTYEMDLWAAAGQCDTSKGVLVGSVTVSYVGGYVTVNYNVAFPYSLEETHAYAGTTKFPQVKQGKKTVSTVAPGQYYNASPFGGGTVYVIAHAVVGIPDPSFGP
jgi:hypothetical protein